VQEQGRELGGAEGSYCTAITYAVRTDDLVLLKQLLQLGNCNFPPSTSPLKQRSQNMQVLTYPFLPPPLAAINVNAPPVPRPGQLSAGSSIDCSSAPPPLPAPTP